jgi:hypothetical protein
VFIANHPEGSIYHHPAWLEAAARDSHGIAGSRLLPGGACREGWRPG